MTINGTTPEPAVHLLKASETTIAVVQTDMFKTESKQTCLMNVGSLKTCKHLTILKQYFVVQHKKKRLRFVARRCHGH